MTVHEKARAYEALKKDYQESLEWLENHQKEVQEIPNREELVAEREYNIGVYYAKLSGSLQGHSIGIDYIIGKIRSDLKYFENLK
jgi:hypothetical protein